MTAMSRNSKTSALHSERGKRGSLLTLLGWLAISPLLTSCVGTASSIIPKQPTQQDAWLSFKFKSGLGTPGCGSYDPQNDPCGLTDQTEAVAYYTALGIANPGTYTFLDWLKANGALNVPQNQIASAIYFNKLDLQFGRDMHCWPNGQGVGCYVVNYGPAPLLNGTANPAWPNRAQALDDANNRRNPFATVAMVFTPCTATPCQANNVSFYVFDNTKEINNDPTTAPLSNVAGLDTEGVKTVPRMCMGCHGGFYTHSDPTTNPPTPASVAGAQFLPFDVISFGLDASSSGQQAFLDLNAFVLATKPQQAIVDFVNGTYPGLAGGVSQPFTQKVAMANVTDFVPLNWSSNTLFDGTPESVPKGLSISTLYGSLVKQNCRMCHLAQARDFATYDDPNNRGNFHDDSGLIEAYACGNGDMPHMEVPFGPQNNTNLVHNGIGLWNDVDAQARQSLYNFLITVNPNHSTNCKTD